VSNAGGNGAQPERAAMDALEDAVGDVLDRVTWLHERVALSREKSEELEELLRRFTSNEVDPGEIVGRLRHLEEENNDLRSRIEQGRASVDRLLAKIRFLEGQQ
jgi:predicted RNase H-like nuclease (RuvC/YqgF family)